MVSQDMVNFGLGNSFLMENGDEIIFPALELLVERHNPWIYAL